MRGEVTSQREAIVQIDVTREPTDTSSAEHLRAILDTGFTDFLTLPHEIVTTLSLRRLRSTKVMLADASTVVLNVYSAYVHWHDNWRRIQVLEASGPPLVGMALLYGSELTIRAIDGGHVRIEPLV